MNEVFKKEGVSDKVNEKNIGFRRFFRESVFESNSFASKIFDVFLLIAILASVTCVILETIPSINQTYGNILIILEWTFTIFFTIEYLLRIISAEKPLRYIFSFFGIIDLISILPLYISIFVKGEQILQIVRLLRLVRIISRLIRFSHNIDKLSQTFLHLRNHLANDEKIILFFRPSRKRRIFNYIFICLAMIAAIIEIIFTFTKDIIIFNIPVLFFVSIIVLLFSFIILLKIEYLIWRERFVITNQRLLHSKGIFHEHFQSKTYQYITDVSLHQTVFDKIMDTGDLIIHTAGGENEEMTITGISSPLKLKKLINDCAITNQNKEQTQQKNASKLSKKL